jgi:hypothetical protein
MGALAILALVLLWFADDALPLESLRRQARRHGGLFVLPLPRPTPRNRRRGP